MRQSHMCRTVGGQEANSICFEEITCMVLLEFTEFLNSFQLVLISSIFKPPLQYQNNKIKETKSTIQNYQATGIKH